MERALVLLAYFIKIDGDIHVAIYERFEAELRDLKKKEAPKARARESNPRMQLGKPGTAITRNV
jgi:hypothetical protein